jgi:hypothetical protein
MLISDKMVGVVKPSGHKVKLQEVVQDIRSVKPVNSSSDIDSLSIRDLGAPEGWAVPEKCYVDIDHAFLTCVYSEGFGKCPCLANFISFLAIVLSVLLRYTDSDYLFGIFKFFLSPKNTTRCIMHDISMTTRCSTSP